MRCEAPLKGMALVGHHSHRVWVVLCGARSLVWDLHVSLPTQDVLYLQLFPRSL